VRKPKPKDEIMYLALAIMSIQYARAEGGSEGVTEWTRAEKYLRGLKAQKETEVNNSEEN